MRVDVYSRQQAIALDPVEGTVVISISSPANDAPLKHGWEDILRLEFHDVTMDEDMARTRGIDSLQGKPIIWFNEGHVRQVEEFVYRHKDKNFLIHCDAGVSRSVAVGLFLREIFDEVELTTHAIHTTKAYNSLVHRMLMRKYWHDQLS
jgi:predicted protein tyrosine phosphatase